MTLFSKMLAEAKDAVEQMDDKWVNQVLYQWIRRFLSEFYSL